MKIIVLHAPTPVSEIGVNTSGCGQSCVASNATDNGRRTTIQNVLSVKTGITDGPDIINLDSDFGVPSLPLYGEGLAACIQWCLSRKHRLVFVHQCNRAAAPVLRGTTKIGHWRILYGYDGVDTVWTMSPWGGTLTTGSLKAFIAADLQRSVEINVVMKADIIPVTVPKPVPTPTITEDDDLMYLASAGVRPKGETLDPNGQGALYIVAGHVKRHLIGAEAASVPQFEKLLGPIKDFSAEPYVLDHMLEGPPYDASYPTTDGYVRPAGWTPPGPA